MNWTTKGVAALVAGTALFFGMGTVTAVALTAHHTTAPAAAVAPAKPVSPAASAKPAPAPTITVKPAPVIIQQPPKVVAPAPPAAAPAAPAGLRYVGNGVYANANTSDAFALNVAADYSGPGVQYVYSPATGQTYAMTYQVVGAGAVIATGGNNAYVQF